MSVRILSAGEAARWNRWLTGLAYSNIRQLWEYGQVLDRYGHVPEFAVLESNGTITAGALLSRRTPSRLVGPVVHTSGGVGLSDPANAEQFDEFVTALIERCRDLNAVSLTVSVRIPALLGEERQPGAQLATVLRDQGFEPEGEPLGTYFVDLSGGPDDLLGRCTRNTRRQIRKAFRVGLTVEPSLDVQDDADFEAAHHAMGSRKGLASLPTGIGALLYPVAEAGAGVLFVARFRGKGRNYAFASSIGHPTPLWAALRDAAPDEECPGTGHALHFGLMAHYQGGGRPCYDFGGAEGPVPDKAHPNYGVWRFKYEFGGAYVQFVGNWKRTLKPVSALAFDLAKRGRDLRGKGR